MTRDSLNAEGIAWVDASYKPGADIPLWWPEIVQIEAHDKNAIFAQNKPASQYLMVVFAQSFFKDLPYFEKDEFSVMAFSDIERILRDPDFTDEESRLLLVHGFEFWQPHCAPIGRVYHHAAYLMKMFMDGDAPELFPDDAPDDKSFVTR